MSAHHTMRSLKFMLGAAFFLFSTPSFGEDLIVFEAQNATYSPGDVVNSEAALKLNAGQTLSLITMEGKILTFTGPYDQVPSSSRGAQGSGVIDALKGLVEAKASDTQSLGVTREAFEDSADSLTAGAPAPLPKPWLIDAALSGDWCVRKKDAFVFWRVDNTDDAAFKIATLDRSWQVNSTWPAGYSKMASPPDMPIQEGETFSIEVGNTKTMITVHELPNSVENSNMLAAWMFQKNCQLQAKALLASLEK